MNKRTYWTTDTLIQKLKTIFGDKYRYDFIEYKKTSEKVSIYCNIHGIFEMCPNDLLRGHGCPKCNQSRGGKLRKDTFENMVKKIKLVHGDKYEIPNQEYVNDKTKIKVICPIHGEFAAAPNMLKMGRGCPQCGKLNAREKNSMSNEEFKEEFLKAYGYEKYDLSKTDLRNRDEFGRVTFICHKKSKNGKEHGEFLMTPNNMLSLHGCPLCKQSRLEHQLQNILIENKIDFQYQCNKRTFKWLEGQSLDFYLPKQNIAIECQGGGHYLPLKQFNGEEGFLKRKELDETKLHKCENNGVKLIYYTNIEKYIDNIQTFNKDTILKAIESHDKSQTEDRTE